ncbi:hypothetical protein J6590_057640 [Homalodisca vitripennis]|nr:hypothetical protein J6590_057640 [Homalodisca vitripennis]
MEMKKTPVEEFITVRKSKHSKSRLSLPCGSLPETLCLKQLPPLVHNTKKVNKKHKLKSSVTNSFVTENPFHVLQIDDDTHESVENYVEVQSSSGQRNRMLVCADSHGRDLAWHLNGLQDSFEAVGFVKPNGRTKQICDRNNITNEVSKEQDLLVIISGTNDIAHNESKEFLMSISETLNQVKEKNVVLVDVPNRYDLPEWSCVNKEIQKTNFEVKEIVKIYNNVRLVEASNAGRELFTRNGMHFNIKGKRWLAQEIINVINRKIVSNPAEVTTDSEITLNLRDKEEELTK